MKPDELLDAVEAEMPMRRRVLEALETLSLALRESLGLPPGRAGAAALTAITRAVCPQAAEPEPVRRTRAAVRRKSAKDAKALRTTDGRRKAAAPGSLTDRILSTLAGFQAPMKKSAVVAAVKALEPDVRAELKRLREDGQVTMIGERSAARWSLPKFANVIVADDAD
jgi:hypothetical protein